MQAGLSSFTYTWAVGVPGHNPSRPLSAASLVRRAAALGVPVVQFADNLDLAGLPTAELDDLVELAARLAVGLEIGTRGIGPRLRRSLEIARRVRATFVRVVLDTATDRPNVREAVHHLAAFEGDFRASGTTLAIENHDRFSVEQLVDLVSALGDWAGICLDTVNSFGALEPPGVVIDALGPLAVNLHIKDFTIRRHDHQMGFSIEGTPAGEGLLDVPGLVRRLDGYGRVATGVLELWTPPAADLNATVAREAEWAERSLRYLRTATALQFRSQARDP